MRKLLVTTSILVGLGNVAAAAAAGPTNQQAPAQTRATSPYPIKGVHKYQFQREDAIQAMSIVIQKFSNLKDRSTYDLAHHIADNPNPLNYMTRLIFEHGLFRENVLHEVLESKPAQGLNHKFMLESLGMHVEPGDVEDQFEEVMQQYIELLRDEWREEAAREAYRLAYKEAYNKEPDFRVVLENARDMSKAPAALKSLYEKHYRQLTAHDFKPNHFINITNPRTEKAAPLKARESVEQPIQEFMQAIRGLQNEDESEEDGKETESDAALGDEDEEQTAPSVSQPKAPSPNAPGGPLPFQPVRQLPFSVKQLSPLTMASKSASARMIENHDNNNDDVPFDDFFYEEVEENTLSPAAEMQSQPVVAALDSTGESSQTGIKNQHIPSSVSKLYSSHREYTLEQVDIYQALEQAYSKASPPGEHSPFLREKLRSFLEFTTNPISQLTQELIAGAIDMKEAAFKASFNRYWQDSALNSLMQKELSSDLKGNVNIEQFVTTYWQELNTQFDMVAKKEAIYRHALEQTGDEEAAHKAVIAALRNAHKDGLKLSPEATNYYYFVTGRPTAASLKARQDSIDQTLSIVRETLKPRAH